MKTFVSLLLTLWSLAGLAQTTIKTAVIAPAPGKSGTAYTVSYERNWQTYPPTTSGLSSLTTAIAEGKLKLTVSGSGCVIAAGTRPPTVAPTCNNASGLPILYANSGLSSKYTYSSANGGTLQIRATGLTSAQIKLETVSGQTLTLSNSQNSTIPYNSFVGYGLSGDSSYPFDWTFWGVPQVPIKVSMKTGGSADVATFTPVVGSDQALSGAGGTTNPPPTTDPTTTVTYRPIQTIVVEANSIGFYPTNVGVGWPNNWGMAASAERLDFFHILKDSVKTIYPNINMLLWGNQLGISVAEGGYFEQDYDRLGDGLHRYDTLSLYAPDVLITRLGENVTEVRPTFQTAWKNQIDRVTVHSANPLKIITTSVWGNSTVDAALIALASNNNWPLVDLRNIAGSRDGVLNHPTDAAHAEYAKRIWAVLKAKLATTTTTTPTTNTTATTATFAGVGYGNVYKANSTYVPLAETSRPAGNYTGIAPWPRSLLSNSSMTIGTNTAIGSVLDYWVVGGGKNLINGVVYGNGREDAGRQLMDAGYSTPDGGNEGHFIAKNGQTTAQAHDPGQNSIGWDPVQGGDAGETPFYGTTVTHHNDGQTLYTKVIPKMWDLSNTDGEIDMEHWISFDPSNARAFRRHARWTLRRTDQYINRFPIARQQEWPCAYIIGDYNHFYVNYGQPYVNAQLTEFVTAPGENQKPRLVTEPFVMACKEANREDCICMYNPYSGRITTGVFGDQQPGGGVIDTQDRFNNAAYMANAALLHLDHDGVYDMDNAFFKGTQAECRAWMYAQPRWSGLPEYTFGVGSRQGFIMEHARDQLEKNINGFLNVTPLGNDPNNGKNMDFVLPEKWVNGRAVSHLYWKCNLTSNSNQYWLTWQKGGSGTEYRRTFTAPNNAQTQVIDIDMSGNADWVGQDITNVKISHVYDNGFPELHANESWKTYWISYRNLDTTN